MTISDVLSGAREEVLKYLEKPAFDDWYGTPEVRRRIGAVIAVLDDTMDRLGKPASPPPDDTLAYLETILKERSRAASMVDKAAESAAWVLY